MNIDLVYLWVNGNDPKWIAKRNACIGKPTGDQENCAARYADSGELKYSLRSVEKNVPWIHKIYIVTDDQVPEWLDTSNPKVQIVDHSEILPEESLPCFNSTLLEHFIHKIPGLSEYFIYGNDDTYFNQAVSPEKFFAEDNLPMIYMYHKPFRKQILSLVSFLRTKILRKPMNLYVQIVWNSAQMVEKKYGKFYSCKPHHNFDSYRKSTIEKINADISKEVEAMHLNHMRRPGEVHRSYYNFAALAENLGHLQYVDQTHSFSLNIHKRQHYQQLEKCNPVFFCMNDSPHATDADRAYSIEYLSRIFPEKSQFEK